MKYDRDFHEYWRNQTHAQWGVKPSLDTVKILLDEIERTVGMLVDAQFTNNILEEELSRLQAESAKLREIGGRLEDIAESNCFCCKKMERFLCSMSDEEGHDEDCAVMEWREVTNE